MMTRRNDSFKKYMLHSREVKDFRLPNDVLPNLYSIQLLPHLENATTDGQVDILVDCIKETKNISLNSRDINIHEQSIKVRFMTIL